LWVVGVLLCEDGESWRLKMLEVLVWDATIKKTINPRYQSYIIKMSQNDAVKNQQAVTVSLDELRDGKFHP
jgi:hypothetical protein